MLDVSIPMTDLLCRMRFISLILLLLCHTHPTTISAGNHVSTFCVFSFCCFLVLDSICKWDNVVFAFLCLIYFTEHPTFWIHPCCYKWQDFIFYDCVCVRLWLCVCVHCSFSVLFSIMGGSFPTFCNLLLWNYFQWEFTLAHPISSLHWGNQCTLGRGLFSPGSILFDSAKPSRDAINLGPIFSLW